MTDRIRMLIVFLILMLAVQPSVAIAWQDQDTPEESTATSTSEASAPDGLSGEPDQAGGGEELPAPDAAPELVNQAEEPAATDVSVVVPLSIVLDRTLPERDADACQLAGIANATLVVDPLVNGPAMDSEMSIELLVQSVDEVDSISWTSFALADVLAVIVIDSGATEQVPANLYDYRPLQGAIVGDAGLQAPSGAAEAVFVCYDRRETGETAPPSSEPASDDDALEPTENTSPTATSRPTDEVLIAAIGIGGSVRNDVRLNFRTSPSLTAGVVGVLLPGTISSVIGGPQSAGGHVWWQLSTSLGNGWAAGTYLIEVSPPAPTATRTPTRTPTVSPGAIGFGDTVRVTTSLNLRSNASTTSTVIAVMTTGTIGTVIGGPQAGSGYTWWQVTTSYGDGWAASQYLVKTGSAASATPTRTPTGTSTGTPPTATFTATPSVTPMPSNTATRTMTPSPTLSPTVSSTPSTCGSFTIGHTVRATTGLNLRATPSTSGQIVNVLPAGARGEVIGGPTSANGYTWCQLSTSGYGTGWAVTTYLAWVSGPFPTPSGTQTPRPDPPTDPGSGRSATIYQGPTTVRQIALTYDAGAERGYAAYILDQLRAFNAKATFGMTGLWAQSNPDLVIRMVNEGHQLINHTWSHPSFTGSSVSSPLALTRTARVNQLTMTEDYISSLTGYQMLPYWRPPYGDINTSVLTDVYTAGYYLTIMWTCDTLAWNGASETAILNRCMYPARSGWIILMHVGADGLDWAATDNMLRYFTDNGYALVTIEEMLS